MSYFLLLAEQFKMMREENEKFRAILSRRKEADFATCIFKKVFQDDPNALAALVDLWKDRTAPQALDLPNEEEDDLSSVVSTLDEQKAWDLRENAAMFFDSIKRLNERLLQTGETITFDKDDEDTMDFVVSAANLRSLVYGIKPQSRFQAKCKRLNTFKIIVIIILYLTLIYSYGW